MKRFLIAALLLPSASFASGLDAVVGKVVDAYGGATAWSKVTQIDASHFDGDTAYASVSRFRKLAQAEGVDTLIAPHQTRDLALQKLEINRLRRAGDPNPFVIGKEGYLRYMDVQTECIYYAAAREGQKF